MADGSVVIEVLLNDDDAINDVDHLNNRLNGLEQSGQKGALGIGKIVTALGLVALGTKIIDTVKGSIQSAFGRIDTMESFERVMTTITGSTENTKKALDSTRDAVTGTAYGLDVAARGVQNFVTRGLDIEKATERITAWGDAVAFYGKGSNEELASVADALAKMSTKGKVEMDQLNRLFDVGIDAVGMYAKATKRDSASVQNDLSYGRISAEEFIDTVTVAMMEGTNGVQKIAGAAKEAGASWGGSIDNMKAAVTRGVVNIIQTIDTMLTNNGLPDMRTMIAEFGKMFEKTLNTISEKIPDVVENIKSIYNTLKPWLPLLSAVAIGVGSVILGIATFNTVKGYILAIKAAFVALNGTIWANPITWVVAAIIAGALLVYTYWEPISGFFKDLWEKVKEYGLAVWDWLKGAWQSTIDFFINIWSSITSFFSNLWNNVKDIAVSIWDSVVAKWNEIIQAVYTFFSPLINFYVDLWSTIFSTASQIWDNIFNMLSTIWDNIKIIASSAWEIIKNVILGPILLLIDLVTGNMEGFKSHLSQIWDNIKNAADRIWQALKNIVLAYVSTLVQNALLVWDTFKSKLDEYWNKIKEKATSTAKALLDFVVSRFNSLKEQAITKMKEFLANIITNWNNIKKAFTDALINIVKTVVTKFTDFKKSAKDKMVETKDTIKSTWDSVMTFFKNIDLKQIGKNIIDGLINGIKSKITAVSNAVKDVTSAITGKIKNILQIHSPSRWMRDEIGVNLMKGFEVGIDKEKSSVINKADESAQWMKPNVEEFINPLRGVSLPLSYNLSSLKGIERNLQLADSKQANNDDDQTSALKEVQAILNIAGNEARGLLKFFTQEQSKEKKRTTRQFKGRLT